MDTESFLARVAEYHEAGWRLALINAASVLPADELPEGAVDVTWAFAREAELGKIRERLAPGSAVPSISGLFPAAFLYENEIRELFGIDVTGISVDLKGQLYKTAEKIPFSPSAVRARLEKTGALNAPAPHGAAHGANGATHGARNA
jgi:ech hydrogenase subunit D